MAKNRTSLKTKTCAGPLTAECLPSRNDGKVRYISGQTTLFRCLDKDRQSSNVTGLLDAHARSEFYYVLADTTYGYTLE